MPHRTLTAVGLVTAGVLLGSTAGAVAATVVTGAQIKDGTITSADVKDGGLAARDLSPGTVKGLKGLTGYELVVDQVIKQPGGPTNLSVPCPSGKRVVGGAAYWGTSNEAVQFGIALDGTAGTAYTGETTDEDLLRVQVVCVKVS